MERRRGETRRRGEEVRTGGEKDRRRGGRTGEGRYEEKRRKE